MRAHIFLKATRHSIGSSPAISMRSSFITPTRLRCRDASRRPKQHACRDGKRAQSVAGVSRPAGPIALRRRRAAPSKTPAAGRSRDGRCVRAAE